MLVTRIAYGVAEVSLTTDDCDKLATACCVAVDNLPGAEDEVTRSLLEAFQSVFVASFHATRLQGKVPVKLAGDGAGCGNHDG
jgi:hypothetical protein